MNDGNYRWVYDEMQIIRDQAGQPQEIVGSWLGITERKQMEDELKRHAQIDLLTGLNNRRHFMIWQNSNWRAPTVMTRRSRY